MSGRLLLAVRGVLWSVGLVTIAVVLWFAGNAATQGAPVEYAPTPAEQLVERHGCWTGDAPADMEGRRPGHAVVTDAEGRTTSSATNVAPALAHVFEGGREGLTVHAFCR